jgi:PilZ domain
MVDNLSPTWLVAGTGLVSAAVIVALGRFFLRRELPPVPAKGEIASDPFEQGSATERRTAARRIGRHVRVFVSDARAEAPPSEGWILDRSVGGLRISLGHQVAPDTVLTVRACNAPDTIPWTQIRVLRCHSRGAFFELGCQFVRTPPWNIMLLFG